MNGIKIRGTGSCLPSRVLTNDDLARQVDTSDEWITARTGIRERRILTAETHSGLCAGAARTALDNGRDRFWLMELCGIERVTVQGTSHGGANDHAWNLVQLDGDWYCVDVTWDDPVASFPIPVSSPLAHRYFNVTSEYLRQTDHQWDESGVPEAEGTALVWAAQ